MKYSDMSSKELEAARLFAITNGNLNAAREISEFQKFYGKRVKTVKGRKVPIGTEGVVFFVKRYDYSLNGDCWGINSNTRVGFKDDSGEAYFTSLNNIVLI